MISNVEANSSSYAGADVQHMALTLVNEKADEVVAELYADYCRSAGLGAGKDRCRSDAACVAIDLNFEREYLQ